MEAKQLMPFVIFVITLAFTTLPGLINRIYSIKRVSSSLMMGSAGFMFYTSIMDIVPHIAEEDHEKEHKHEEGEHEESHSGKHKHKKEHHHEHKFNIGLFSCGISFIFLFFIDTVFLKHSHENGDTHSHSHENHGGHNCMDEIKNKGSKKQALIYLLAVSIHSFFEGFACIYYPKNAWGRWASLLTHKSLESISIGVSILQTKFDFIFICLLFFIYSALTPLGFLFGIIFKEIRYAEKVLNGISLGSIFFVVFIEIIPIAMQSKKKGGVDVAAFMGGYFVPAVVTGLLNLIKTVVARKTKSKLH